MVDREFDVAGKPGELTVGIFSRVRTVAGKRGPLYRAVKKTHVKTVIPSSVKPGDNIRRRGTLIPVIERAMMRVCELCNARISLRRSLFDPCSMFDKIGRIVLDCIVEFVEEPSIMAGSSNPLPTYFTRVL